MERFTVIALQPPLHLSFFFFFVMQAYFFFNENYLRHKYTHTRAD